MEDVTREHASLREQWSRWRLLLPALHGRIERNHWVTQGTEFVRLGTAAARPAEPVDTSGLP